MTNPWPAVAVDRDLKRARLEWLHTNGAGAYASSTLAGMHTRRYHGLLVAALDPPRGRHVFLSHVDATVTLRRASSGAPVAAGAPASSASSSRPSSRPKWELGKHQFPGVDPEGSPFYLERFDQNPLPRWTYSRRRRQARGDPRAGARRERGGAALRLRAGRAGLALAARPAHAAAPARGPQLPPPAARARRHAPAHRAARRGDARAAAQGAAAHLLPVRGHLRRVAGLVAPLRVPRRARPRARLPGGFCGRRGTSRSPSTASPRTSWWPSRSSPRASRRRCSRPPAPPSSPRIRGRPTPPARAQPDPRCGGLPGGPRAPPRRHRRVPLVRGVGARHAHRAARALPRDRQGRRRAAHPPRDDWGDGGRPRPQPHPRRRRGARVPHRRRHPLALRGGAARRRHARRSPPLRHRRAAPRPARRLRGGAARHPQRHPRHRRRPLRRRQARRLAHLDGRPRRRPRRHLPRGLPGGADRPLGPRLRHPGAPRPRRGGRRAPHPRRGRARPRPQRLPGPLLVRLHRLPVRRRLRGRRRRGILPRRIRSAPTRSSRSRSIPTPSPPRRPPPSSSAPGRIRSRPPACARSPPASQATPGATPAASSPATAPTTRARCGPGSSAPTCARLCASAAVDRAELAALVASTAANVLAVGQVPEIAGGDAPHAPAGCVAQAWSVAELLRALVWDLGGGRA